jgi:gamma-glutamyltranspeptidase
VFEEKLYPLNTVRMLPRILKNAEAKRVFLKEGARKAATVLEKPDFSKTLLDADVTQLSRALNIKILKMPFAEMQSLKQDPGGDTAQELVQALENLQGLLTQLDLAPVSG